MVDHGEVVLLPSVSENGFAVRAQWYLPQEWFADADPASAVAAIAPSAARMTTFFKAAPFHTEKPPGQPGARSLPWRHLLVKHHGPGARRSFLQRDGSARESGRRAEMWPWPERLSPGCATRRLLTVVVAACRPAQRPQAPRR